MNNIKLYYLYTNDITNEIYNKEINNISTERKERINKYKFMKDKKLSLGAEILLKYGLKELKINENKIIYNSNGKPYLNNNEIYFNISHSENIVICVFSNNEIGCDIEYIKDINTNISKNFFTENEHISINNDINNFYRLWTLKESFIKNIGKGLSIDLKEFEIDLNNLSIKQNINKNTYYFKEINNFNNYKCSICLLENKSIDVKQLVF